MSLVIRLPQDTERRLRESAARLGQRPEEFVVSLVESGLSRSLDEDLALFRRAVLATGETDEDTGAFFQSVVDEYRADQARGAT